MPFPTPLSVLTLLDPSSPTTVCRSSLSVATLSPPLLSVRLSVTSRRSSAMLPLTSSRRCPLLLEVKGNIAELLLDVTDNLALSGGGERVATLGEDLHQVVGEFTSSKIKTDNGMGKGIT